MKKIFSIAILLSIFITSLAGCSKSGEEANSSEARVIKVGAMGTYEPFSFQDEKGKITGYDIEVLREVEKRTPGLKFEFIASPWDTLFVSLDADKFQLLANQITSNPDRVAKYLLTDNSYFADITQPIIRQDDDSIKSLADLHNKTVGVTVGDSHTRALEEYNAAHGQPIKIKYYEGDINTVLQDVVSGRIDATVNNPIMAKKKAETMGLAIKSINESLVENPALFIMKNDGPGQELKAALDKALTEMKADGTLSRLSKEWFGEDYIKTR